MSQNVPPAFPPTSQYRPVSVGDWILTFLILALPVINIIMAFVWGFSDSTHPSKRSFCQAALIMWGISIVLSIIVFGILVVLGVALSSAPQ